MSAVGVVLAGGRGRRMGGAKATVELDGVALVHYPLRALGEVTGRRAVVVKAHTPLPVLPADVAVWVEPELPQHPLTGVLHALREAAGAPVLCCAVDLPRLTPAVLRRLLDAAPGEHGCVVPRAGGRLQPLCALWLPAARTVLEALASDVSMHGAVAAADALEVAFGDVRPFANVNAPEDLESLPRG